MAYAPLPATDTSDDGNFEAEIKETKKGASSASAMTQTQGKGQDKQGKQGKGQQGAYEQLTQDLVAVSLSDSATSPHYPTSSTGYLPVSPTGDHSEHTEHTGGDDERSPEEKAGLFSRWTYSYMTPMLKLGSQRPLEFGDLQVCCLLVVFSCCWSFVVLLVVGVRVSACLVVWHAVLWFLSCSVPP